MNTLIFISILIFVINGTSSQVSLPAFKTLTTIEGVQQLQDSLLPLVQPYVLQASFPSFSGKVDDVSYTVSNMQIQQFDFDLTEAQFAAGTDIVLVTLAGTSCIVTMDWSYKTLILSGSGTATDTMTLNTEANLVITSNNGDFLIQSQNVVVEITSLNIKLSGGASWFYQMFVDIFKNTISSVFQSTIQSQLSNAINQIGAQYSSQIPMNYQFGKNLILDYSLTQNPVFFSNYSEMDHLGGWIVEGNPLNCINDQQVLPNDLFPQKSITFIISEVLFDCLGDAIFSLDVLNTVITPEMVPSVSPIKLNTNDKTLQSAIPNLYSMYPNQPINLLINVLEAPETTILETNFTIYFIMNINVTVVVNGTVEIPVFDVILKLWSTGQVSLDDSSGSTLIGKIIGESHNITLMESYVGEVDVEDLDYIVRFFISLGIEPELNAIGQQGFPLNNMEGLEFLVPELNLKPGYIQVGTNFMYSPSSSSAQKPIISSYRSSKSIEIQN